MIFPKCAALPQVKLERKQEDEIIEHTVKEEKESGPGREVLSRGSEYFTLRLCGSVVLVLVFLPLQLSIHLRPSSPHHGFPFFTLNSLARCLPPTMLFVEAAKCRELPTPRSCRELHDT